MFSGLWCHGDLFLPVHFFCQLFYILILMFYIGLFYIHLFHISLFHILMLYLTLSCILLRPINFREQMILLNFIWRLWLVHPTPYVTYYFHDFIRVKRRYTENPQTKEDNYSSQFMFVITKKKFHYNK